jgi:hypothetical protein
MSDRPSHLDQPDGLLTLSLNAFSEVTAGSDEILRGARARHRPVALHIIRRGSCRGILQHVNPAGQARVQEAWQ